MRRASRLASSLAFLVLVLMGAALAGLNIQAWRGELVAGEQWGGLPAGDSTGDRRAVAGTLAAPAELGAGRLDDEEARAGTNEPRPATFRITAARGDSWLAIRSGSSRGRLLYEGVLARGKSLTFARTRLWLRLGAAGNVDLTVNGRAAGHLPTGTVDVVATRQGVRSLR